MVGLRARGRAYLASRPVGARIIRALTAAAPALWPGAPLDEELKRESLPETKKGAKSTNQELVPVWAWDQSFLESRKGSPE